MERARVLILVLSLVFGITGACVLAEYEPEFQAVHREERAWWGALYPEYVLPGAMRLVGEEEQGSEGLPVKIRFKYMRFLNQAE
jgi:hypothetical protein